MSSWEGVMSAMPSGEKHLLDLGAGAIAAGALLKWLPAIAAALSIVWLLARLYEYTRWVWRGRIRNEKP